MMQSEEESKQIAAKKRKFAAKKARITREYRKLVSLYNSSQVNSHIIKKLCARASFLLILAEDIERDINNDDLTVLTINASQSFVKANPLMKDYRDTVKSYQTVIKQLTDLSKNSNSQVPGSNDPDELEEFMNA